MVWVMSSIHRLDSLINLTLVIHNFTFDLEMTCCSQSWSGRELLVTVHFGFSQIMMERAEEAGKTPEKARAGTNLKCKYLCVWLKAALGNILPGFRCII